MPAAGDLPTQVYHELRRLAQAKLAAEKLGHTLDATALVHEAAADGHDTMPDWRIGG